MWSSCPCVRNTAATLWPRPSRYARSGTTRSTPSRSGSGNITPASTTMVVSPQVMAIVFMPNSRRPPSGTTSTGCASVFSGTVISLESIPGCRRCADDTSVAAIRCDGSFTRAAPRSPVKVGDRRRGHGQPTDLAGASVGLQNSDPLGWAESAKSYNGQQDTTGMVGTARRAVRRRTPRRGVPTSGPRRPTSRTPRGSGSRRGAGRRCQPRPTTPSRPPPRPWRATAASCRASCGAG